MAAAAAMGVFQRILKPGRGLKLEVYIAAGMLAAVILTSTSGIVWKLSRVELSIRADHAAEIAAMRTDYVTQIAGLRTDYVRDIADLNAKVYKIEIWARDEFVRKTSFETVIARLEKGMETLGNKVEGAVDKMAERIEKLNHHGQV
jgi:hypothetical protein